jgi:hypothetical protein
VRIAQAVNAILAWALRLCPVPPLRYNEGVAGIAEPNVVIGLLSVSNSTGHWRARPGQAAHTAGRAETVGTGGTALAARPALGHLPFTV